MSLINEALKRTEQQKLNESASAAGPEAMEPARHEPGALNRSPMMLTLLGAAIAVALVGGWMVLRGGAGGTAPDAATGDIRPAPPAGPVASQAASDREIRQAIAETIRAVRYYDPNASSGTKPQSTDGAGKAADKSQGHRRPRDTTTRPARLATAATSPTKTPPRPAPPPAPKPRESDFKLSGIMRGPDGTVAIINGRYVRVGQTVSGAKVVNIGRHSVELQAGGQRLIIQM